MALLDRAVAAVVPRLPRTIVGRVARRYISGSDLESALDVTARLNRARMTTTLDILGEDVLEPSEARSTVAQYLEVLRELDERKLDGNISVKPTHLGLKLDRDRCLENLRELVADGAGRSIFVRIDMEDSTTTTDTLELYRELRKSHDNLGVVLQSRLRRSEQDARELAAMGARVRVCKGIYQEPPEIAYVDGGEINRSFLRIVDTLLSHGCHVGVATHDPDLVNGTYRILERTPGASYEFQMLLGVTERLRDEIVAAGHPLRVYVPFGKEWYAYSIRRLRENPQIAGHVFRSLLRRS